MSKREQKNILIEKFLRKELSEDELAIFQELWNSDPSFVKEVQDYSRLTVALKAADRLDKGKVTTRVITHFKNAFFKYQSVAAIVLLAVMLPLYLLLQGQKRAITAESPEVSVLAKSNFSKANDRFQELNEQENLEAAYKAGKTEEAISLLKEFEIESNQSYPFLLADLYFEAGKPDSALHYYGLGLRDYPNDTAAYWNSLMSELLAGDFAQAKEELREWAQISNTDYGRQARQLLLELE